MGQSSTLNHDLPNIIGSTADLLAVKHSKDSTVSVGDARGQSSMEDADPYNMQRENNKKVHSLNDASTLAPILRKANGAYER